MNKLKSLVSTIGNIENTCWLLSVWNVKLEAMRLWLPVQPCGLGHVVQRPSDPSLNKLRLAVTM